MNILILNEIIIFYLIFFQAEDGIRDFCLSRGLGDVYKRQDEMLEVTPDSIRMRKINKKKRN